MRLVGPGWKEKKRCPMRPEWCIEEMLRYEAYSVVHSDSLIIYLSALLYISKE